MENKRANLVALTIISLLIISIIVARVCLKLSKTFFLICGAAVAAIFAVSTIIIIRARFDTRRKQLESQLDSQGRELRIEYSFLRKVAGVPTKFRHRELEEATDGFRSLLGRGASGAVFKGILSDGTPVAVKRIDGEERGEKVFKSEVAAIASLQHVNLVRLLGYCISSTGPRFLVYEFVHHGSLNNWIFPKMSAIGQQRSGGGCLSWDLRCRVAVDVAKALSYLHHDCRSCILHLDVKPENILIDENFHAVVADFGLSKLKGREESRVVTTIRGTRGYLAPEWLLENGVSEKCDVYSYGMVLLEIIGGRRGICMLDQKGDNKFTKKTFQFFPKIVIEKLREGKLMEIVDERLLARGERIEERLIKRMVQVALWCIQEKPKHRPSMSQVVEMLEGHEPIEDPPYTQMLVVDLLSIDEHDDDDGNLNKRNYRKARFVQMNRESPSTSVSCSCVFSSIIGR